MFSYFLVNKLHVHKAFSRFFPFFRRPPANIVAYIIIILINNSSLWQDETWPAFGACFDQLNLVTKTCTDRTLEFLYAHSFHFSVFHFKIVCTVWSLHYLCRIVISAVYAVLDHIRVFRLWFTIINYIRCVAQSFHFMLCCVLLQYEWPEASLCPQLVMGGIEKNRTIIYRQKNTDIPVFPNIVM
jgi:uncharacterized membrane protein (DUF2068 family)